jgi:hypothetical protein
MKIIPLQKRTIFIEYRLDDQDIIQKYKGKLDNYNNKSIFKFNLNMPKMLLNIRDEKAIELHAINETNQLCHSPLLNTSHDNHICLNIQTIDYKIALDKIYNSAYNLDSYASVNTHYIKNLNKISQILQFYQNWQDTGKIQLVPFNDITPYYYKHLDYINKNV